jgi:hypothetical protein
MVTYKNKTVANRAVEEMGAKGVAVFLLQSGTQWQLCGNAYESNEKAKQGLTDLKAKNIIPADAFIRPMPH